VPPIVRPNGFGGYPSGETSPSAPVPPADPQGSQPFTGFPGHTYATPAYQDPGLPVDPRSQQLHDAYQQAETYQHTSQHPGRHGTGASQPEPQASGNSGWQPRPYDDPFGHPQQPEGTHRAGARQRPAASPTAYGTYEPYEPQSAHYESRPYQPQPHSSGWDDHDQAESTVRLDQSSYRPDPQRDQRRGDGDEPIDPTAIYTPNEPRR
jgi:hypothetical protein